MTTKTDNAAAQLLHHTADQNQAESDFEHLPPSHEVWDRKKAGADLVAGVYAQAGDTRIRKHAETVGKCSETLFLSEVVNRETGEIGRKAQSWKCRERHCPICQSARARKLHREFAAVLPAIMEQVSGGVFLFLTLTVRNCPIEELRATLADMGKAWKRLLLKPEFRIVKGWIRGTEVTRALDGQAHPHFHALLLVPPSYFSKYYIKQEKWVELWQAAARLNYPPSVDIRRVKTAKGGIEEAVKAATYSVKPSDLEADPAWFHKLHEQVSSLRFLATGGIIKAALGAKATGEADDIAEGKEPEGEQGRTLVFDWRRPEKRYRRRHR
jgi:plasmid rolling circle replication initiator protein Rep